MAEFDDTQRFAGGWPPAPGYGQAPGMGAAPGGTGPLGDWLHEAGAAWAAGPQGYGPPGQAPPGHVAAGQTPAHAGPGPVMAPHTAAWVTPPHLDAEEPRSRWSISTTAPWVVAGLLCALLLTGREAPAAAPVEAPAELAGQAQPPVDGLAAAAVPAGPAPACAAVTP